MNLFFCRRLLLPPASWEAPCLTSYPGFCAERKDLSFRQESTLGETLSKLPGVSSTYFGPNSSRPVIRGLDGDRIRIMQNGVGMLDVSSLSPDHATAVDPLLIDRVEVVRGPAALMYGGAAVGGVVNTLDNRIPQSSIKGFTGRVEPRIAVPPTSVAVQLCLKPAMA